MMSEELRKLIIVKPSDNGGFSIYYSLLSIYNSLLHPQRPAIPVFSFHKLVGFIKVGHFHIFCIPE